MPTPTPTPRIWALRHGQSRANLEGVIVSQPGPLAFEWAGLTARGREQAREAAEHTWLGSTAVLITSDFARAYETAELVALAWGATAPVVDTRLRERNFGGLEGHGAQRYDEVWAADALGERLPEGVETTEAVAARTRAVVEEVLSGAHPALASIARDRAGGIDAVLVAHGDVLQIAQAWMSGAAPSQHRSLKHLENAELRRLH